MDLSDATRMILSESAAHPELLRVTREAHDRLARGDRVQHTELGWMLKEAARKNVYPALRTRYGVAAFNEMVLVLGREIDRQAPVPARTR
ncbi:hypothetical protein HUT06_00200 [Actinomadura sp. NAK00032]|uniref:hypothetical protein n=1 Tax=Actinomadura sp. NAK00032 TaxID=2742128 RepID=UPI0015905037|nr:hypothetical protein [Actinomadura sp. NAK00032]QKW32651.1 hypothetical protein HUT06_00200 [Actinomadura sp. NAK00032]